MPFVSAAGDNYCTRFSSYQSTVASGYSKLTRHQPVWSDTSLVTLVECKDNTHTHTHTHTRLTALFQGLPRWAGTRKVKPLWILLKQETVSGSGISWAMCKSAPHSRQITMPAPHWIKYCTMMTVRRNRSDSQGKEWDGIRGYENLGLCKQCTVPWHTHTPTI